MTENANTTAGQLTKICELGRQAGLRYVYAGNAPGRVGEWEDTPCPDCGDVLIERTGFHVRQQRVTRQGTCPSCGARIAGIWQ